MNLPRRASASLNTTPFIRMRFSDDVFPDNIITSDEETEKNSDTASVISLFALPSTGGALILHKKAFRHLLYPEGKTVFLLPAETSSEIIIPS